MVGSNVGSTVGKILQNISNAESISIFQNITALNVSITTIIISYNSPSPTLNPTEAPTRPFLPLHNSQNNNNILSQNGLIGVLVASGVIFCCLLISIVFYIYNKYFKRDVESEYNITTIQPPNNNTTITSNEDTKNIPAQNETKIVLSHVPSPYDILGDSSYHREQDIILGSDISSLTILNAQIIDGNTTSPQSLALRTEENRI